MNIIERHIRKSIWTFVKNIDVAKRSPHRVILDREYSVTITFVNSINPNVVRECLELQYDVITLDTSFYLNEIRVTMTDPILSYFRINSEGEGIAELIVKNIDLKYGGQKE